MRKKFTVGSLYSNEEVFHALGVGNAGGIRLNTRDDGSIRRIIVMTSLANAKQLAENPYHDRLEGDTLVYTAAGRQGHQTLTGANSRICQQVSGGFPIWGFQLQRSRRDVAAGPKRWQFLGLLEYVRSYTDVQIDISGANRSVWLFEFRVHSKPTEVLASGDAKTMAELLAATRLIVDPDREVSVETIQASPTYQELEAIRRILLAQPPERFESTIRDVLVSTGYRDVIVTRYSQDGGIDVNAFVGEFGWPVRHLMVQVQAKRWLHTVGRREVAELRGSLKPFAAGCLVTTSHFSRAALAEAKDTGKTPITLVNGHEFASLLLTCGVIPS